MNRLIIFVKQILYFVLGKCIYDYLRLIFRILKVFIHYPDYNDPTINFQRNLIENGDIVFDIGSNKGFFTYKYSSMVGNRGKIYSIEPVNSTFKLQEKFLRILKVKNVKMFNIALSNKVGYIKIVIPKTGILPEDSCAYIKQTTFCSLYLSYAKKEDLVRSETLNTIIENESINDISFIKVDVEGAEFLVLKGATKGLEMEPIIFIEIIPRYFKKFDYTEKDIFEFMKSYGYFPYIYSDSQKKLIYSPNYNKTHLDYYFIGKSKIRKLLPRGLLLDF